MAKRKLSFEDALQQLERIAQEIEEGKIGLEDSITQYERGMTLVKQCRDILAKAELKIHRLQERAGGILESVPAERMEGDGS